jgi:glycosyltransferase involved in cell wall biosynthesis
VIEFERRGSADFSRVRRLRAALKGFAPHVLHTVLWSGNSYGRLAAIGLGIPVIIAAERVAIQRPPWQILIERALDRVTDAYLVNCAAIADVLVGRGGVARTKIRVVTNGIDLAQVPPFAVDRTAARAAAGRPARRLVAQVGRLVPQKDYPTFLRAAALVAAEVPDVDFLVIGEGEEREALQRQAAELGIQSRVEFTGLRHDVQQLLAQVDVLALTSVFEGFPNVVMEAMTCGAVAVATDVGGCRELIVDGKNGVLVPPSSPEAVATAVLRILHDPELAHRLALAARRWIETECAVEVMTARTEAVYREMLQGGAASAAA